jgi:hypothetical protein
MTTLVSIPIDHEAWFDRGKTDAWLEQPKSTPEHDPTAASWYDLGYGEGVTQASPLKARSDAQSTVPETTIQYPTPV